MIFPTQYHLPSYNRWLLDEADLAPAYRYHRRYLQHLQSGVPGQWLLKSRAVMEIEGVEKPAFIAETLALCIV